MGIAAARLGDGLQCSADPGPEPSTPTTTAGDVNGSGMLNFPRGERFHLPTLNGAATRRAESPRWAGKVGDPPAATASAVHQVDVDRVHGLLEEPFGVVTGAGCGSGVSSFAPAALPRRIWSGPAAGQA